MSVAKKIIMGVDTGPSVKTIANSIAWSKPTGEALYKVYSSAADSNTTYTNSIWYKVGGANSYTIMGTTSNNAGGGNSYAFIYLYENYLGFDVYNYNNGGTRQRLRAAVNSTLFGVNGDWHHLHIAVDSTQGTSTDRVKIYIDGTQQSFQSGHAVYPPQHQNMYPLTSISNGTHFDGAGKALTSYIGNGFTSINYTTYGFTGNLADVNVVDGIALPVDTFAMDIGGTWTPLEYTGSYGSNGFNFNMANGAFGTDSSGNGNNFTAVNIASGDVSTDVPPA
jgi:hypothetical protein